VFASRWFVRRPRYRREGCRKRAARSRGGRVARRDIRGDDPIPDLCLLAKETDHPGPAAKDDLRAREQALSIGTDPAALGAAVLNE
jgi:hypothetical protein